MSTKPPIAARIPSARPKTLLTSICPSFVEPARDHRADAPIGRMIMQPPKNRREAAA